MKKIIASVAGLLLTGVLFSQTAIDMPAGSAKILLKTGQKIVAITEMNMQGDFGMGMQINSTTASENTLSVKGSAADNYTISNTLTKIKVDMAMMGQNNSYDSENKGNSNGDMVKAFEDKLNKPTDVVLDSKTGAGSLLNKKAAKNESASGNPVDGIMKMFGDASEEGIVSSAFIVIPQGKKIGDSWSDTSKSKDVKSIRVFTLKSLVGNDAVLEIITSAKAKNNLDFQGMEFQINTTTKTKDEIVADVNTSLVKQRTSSSDVTGSFQMMGQDMPITAKVTSTSKYQ